MQIIGHLNFVYSEGKMENLFTAPHFVLSAPWMWTSFGVIVLVLLYLDLFVFHRHAEEPKLSGTLAACIFYIAIALLFGIFVIYERGMETGMLYYTGFLVEKSLSLDNIFIICS